MSTSHDFADQPLPSPLRQHGIVLQRLEGTLYTSVPHLVTHHSPTGYNWGYGGSGPADLALNILEWALREDGHQGPTVACWRGRCLQRAWDLHQRFKRQVIAACQRDVAQIPLAVVRDWLARAADDTPRPYDTP